MKVVKRILAWLCLAILVAGVAVTGAIGVQGYWMYRDALSQTPLEEKVEAVRAQEDYVPLSGLPPIYAQAVVAAEDRRFYEHGGFDIISTARAALANLLRNEWMLRHPERWKKARIQETDERSQRLTAQAAQLAGDTDAEVVQVIGRKVTLYRRNAKKPVITLD